MRYSVDVFTCECITIFWLCLKSIATTLLHNTYYTSLPNIKYLLYRILVIEPVFLILLVNRRCMKSWYSKKTRNPVYPRMNVLSGVTGVSRSSMMIELNNRRWQSTDYDRFLLEGNDEAANVNGIDHLLLPSPMPMLKHCQRIYRLL